MASSPRPTPYRDVSRRVGAGGSDQPTARGPGPARCGVGIDVRIGAVRIGVARIGVSRIGTGPAVVTAPVGGRAAR